MEEKKIFSINKVCYLVSKNLKWQDIGIEWNAEKQRDFVYFVFEENEEVLKALEDYKNNRELQEFNSAFGIVKDAIRKVKEI